MTCWGQIMMIWRWARIIYRINKITFHTLGRLSTLSKRSRKSRTAGTRIIRPEMRLLNSSTHPWHFEKWEMWEESRKKIRLGHLVHDHWLTCRSEKHMGAKGEGQKRRRGWRSTDGFDKFFKWWESWRLWDPESSPECMIWRQRRSVHVRCKWSVEIQSDQAFYKIWSFFKEREETENFLDASRSVNCRITNVSQKTDLLLSRQ